MSDRYARRSLVAASILALSIAGIYRFLDFVPIGPHSATGITAVRNASGLLFAPLAALALLLFAVIGVIRILIAVFRREPKRVASLVGAIAIIPLIIWATVSTNLGDPYYWYVLMNRNGFAETAKDERDRPLPLFVRLETRDVSTGLLTNPAKFISIVYDGSDSLASNPDLSARLSQIDNRGGWFEGSDMTVRRLHGHFYRVTEFVGP